MKESHQATDLAQPPTHWTCPFCGLLCDDLPGPAVTGSLSDTRETLQALCPRAASALDTALGASANVTHPAGAGVLDAVAAMLRAARRPVIGGLGVDVQGARAALALADRCGARLVHRNQPAVQRGLFALQSRGAVTTTFAEARNRADLIVVVGGDPTADYPRILERLFVPDPPFVEAGRRRLVLLGAPRPQRLPEQVAVETVDCGGLDLHDAVAVLGACIAEGVPAEAVAAPPGLRRLAADMQACRYGTLLWSAAKFESAGADLLVERLNQLCFELNARTRWAALPLGGSHGDYTANAVSAWQTGFALPVDFAGRAVAYDPYPDYADADLLLWVAALPGVGMPLLPGLPEGTPTVVIGAPELAPYCAAAAAFVPVALPGVSAAGHLIRSDGSITLHAKPLTATGLPTAAATLDAIAARLEGAHA